VVVTVVQSGEAALGGGATEAVEGTQRRILLIFDRLGPWLGAEPGLGELDQAGEVATPKRLGGVELAAAEGAEPMRNGAGVVERHESSLRCGALARKWAPGYASRDTIPPIRTARAGRTKSSRKFHEVRGTSGDHPAVSLVDGPSGGMDTPHGVARK
jgi:hypothetical protein